MSEGMTPRGRSNVLGVGVIPTTLEQAVATIERWRDEGRRDYVCCVSVHGIVTAQRDALVRDALNRAGLATEDGVPLVWWSRWTGAPRARRVCGPDLLEEMCERAGASGHRHYFYGSTPETIELLVTRLRQRYPTLTIAGYSSPPFRALTDEEDAAAVAEINATRPDYVWIGLGMPKQEKWMASHVGRVEAAALLGVGAAFDFSAGTVARAPGWMQRTGLEWLFRLICEPRRLARRYLIDNLVFIAYAFMQLTGLRTFGRDWEGGTSYLNVRLSPEADSVAAELSRGP
jgi:N-acetylglucosaminyldiphosphoundecaprenol N-acetyl-beta-D-mannosaminyltransferase